MKRAHKIEAIIVTTLILTGTAILVYQFYFNRNFLYSQARFLFENERYKEAIPKYRLFLSRYKNGEHLQQAKKELVVSTYHRIGGVEERLTQIERVLDAMTKIVASKHRDDLRASSRRVIPVSRVLDRATLAPIQGVHFAFSGWGHSGETDANGIFSDCKYGFPDRLRRGDTLSLYHPGYEIQREMNYRLDSTDMVTFLMRKGGDAAFLVKVDLIVRGKKVEHPCSIQVSRAGTGKEVRSIWYTKDRTCRFSGLASGRYVVTVNFWSYDLSGCHFVTLEKGQHKVVEIDVKTDQRPRITLRGLVVNKRDGKPLKGVRIHFTGSSDGAWTAEDGSFSTNADRTRFRQTYLNFHGRWRVWIRLPVRIKEDVARNLELHLDPEVGYNGNQLRDEDEDGIYCDKNGCILCDRH